MAISTPKAPLTLRNLSEQVAEACQLIEGPQGVVQVLLALVNGEKVPTRDLARQSRLPLPIVAAIKNELQKRGILRTDGPATLSDMGRSLMQRSLGGTRFQETLCPVCKGRGHRWPPGFPELLNKVTNYSRNRPRVDVKLDQSQAEPETSLLRASYMVARGAVLGKRVLLLGDDDLISLSLLLWVRETVGPDALKQCHVVVVDLDERYLEFIQEMSDRENLSVQTIHHDLRSPLPKSIGTFDTFATDPPYTPAGCRLFVSRGIERTVKDGTGMGFLSFAQSRSDLLGEVQKSLADMGLVILAMIPMFNRYLGCSVLANSSALFQLAVLPDSTPLIQDVYKGTLYTRDGKTKLKKYRCLKCKCEFEVGPGQEFQTIEALKEHGCSSCSGKKFKAYG